MMEHAFEKLLGVAELEVLKGERLGVAPWESTASALLAETASLLGYNSGDATDALIASAGGPVHAWFETLDGHHKTVSVPAEAAIALGRAGMTLYVPHHKRLDSLCRALERTLGLAKKRIGASVFVQHAGARTVRHFDALDILVVQLDGEKMWWLGENHEAPDPFMSCAENDPSAERLAYYSALPEGETLHESWTPTEHRLSAGSVLYVPRGFWHSTQTIKHGISVHFVLRVPTWLDVMNEAVSLAMVGDPAFRKSAYALGDAGARSRGEVRAEVEGLLERLRGHLAALDADDVVAGSNDREPADRYVRRAFATVRGTRAARPGEWDVHVASLGFGRDRVTELEVGEDAWAACRAVDALTPGTPVTPEKVCAEVPGLSFEDATSVLAVLASAGLVRADAT